MMTPTTYQLQQSDERYKYICALEANVEWYTDAHIRLMRRMGIAGGTCADTVTAVIKKLDAMESAIAAAAVPAPT